MIHLKTNAKPMYVRLADAMRDAIRQGSLTPGEPIPSTRDLAERFGIHRHTVMNAVNELIAEGWIESHMRSRYRVVATLPSKFLSPKVFARRTPSSEAVSIPVQRQVRDFVRSPSKQIKFQFPSGAPDLRLFPTQELKSHMYDALSSPRNLGYGSPCGNERLIRQIDIYLRRMRHVSDREIVITNGSQEAIFLLAQLLIKPGDHVAVEQYGYPPAFEALKFAGARLHGVRVDDDGIVVDDLAKIAQTKKIRMLYLTPLHQYPTTVSLSASRRLQLYELASKHRIYILEDDYDHEFHFDSQPIAPLASFDPSGIVHYVSTFSKILFPSSRIGFMSVPPGFGGEVSKLKRIMSRQNESLSQDAVARWMESGGFERHLRRMRRTYEERRNGMHNDLLEWQRKYPNLSWTKPEGGMALWLDTGINSDELAQRVLHRNVFVMPESWYHLKQKPGSHLRLGFSSQTCDENSSGLKALFSAF